MGLSTEGQAGRGVGFGLWPEQKDKLALVPTLAPTVSQTWNESLHQLFYLLGLGPRLSLWH